MYQTRELLCNQRTYQTLECEPVKKCGISNVEGIAVVKRAVGSRSRIYLPGFSLEMMNVEECRSTCYFQKLTLLNWTARPTNFLTTVPIFSS